LVSEKIFEKFTNQKQELPMVVMFVIRAERNENRGPSIDDSYQASVHLAKQFQRRRFFEIDNQQQELPIFV
jgi:hypothetical protein